MTDQPETRRGTREQTRQYLNEQGYPLSKGTFNQLCSPSRNAGPPIAGYWGRSPVYDFSEALEWAQMRLRTEPYVIHPQAEARDSHEQT